LAAIFLPSCAVFPHPSLAGSDPVAATRIEWTTLKTAGNDKQPVAVTYTVSADLTRISGPEETILVDYLGSRIYRIDALDQSCRSYPFGRPHADLPAAAVSIAAFKTAPDRWRISFGMRSALAQTAVAAVPQLWGRQFPFAIAEYRTSRDNPGIVDLLVIAGRHRRVFQQYPLLRRIDPVGLIDLLKGFPVSGSIFSPAGQTIVTVQAPPRVGAGIAYPSLPENCTEMP